MKLRELYVTALLLVLVGIAIGTIIALYSVHQNSPPLSEVVITEVKRTDAPFYEDDDLAGFDARFVFKQIAEDVIPTVVYIETIIPIHTAEDENQNFSDNIWDRLVPKRASTVGSGVLITNNGYIITNNHVIEGAVKNGLNVILNDKREFPAQLVGQDPTTDLAVIKINAANLPTSIVGNSDRVDVGEWVLAIGNPFRLKSTVTAGIVSALSRDVQIINDRRKIESFIQTDAAINKGNSGGALVNTAGELIGINTAIASQSGNYQGYGFAVPSNLALKVATDIIQYGKVKRALLGVNIAAVDYKRAQEIEMDNIRGVEILGVNEHSAADVSGIKKGDVILSVNGQQVNESNELQEKVAVMRPGESIDLLIWRSGNEIRKSVELMMLQPQPLEELVFEEEPILRDSEQENNNYGVDFYESDFGFRIMAIVKPYNRQSYDLLVSHVYKYSEAWNRGLREGQKILSINEEIVEDIKTLKDSISKHTSENGSLSLKIVNENKAIGYVELERK